VSNVAVVKIGTSSLTDVDGVIVDAALRKLGEDVATARTAGYDIVLVVSGAIAAGMPALKLEERPTDVALLQAIAAVGQPRLMERIVEILDWHGLVAGQVLLTSTDFGHRTQYLHARDTLRRLLDLGVVPVVNENDTVADEEIRFGDNDRLAALVAHLVGARTLLMLTDTEGMFTADPRLDEGASLIEEIAEVDDALVAAAGGAGTARGSGGMASKLAAARIASWSGVRAVIAAARRERVVIDALDGLSVGTTVAPKARALSSRKLWIAFARPSAGRITVDAGAVAALARGGSSLLPAGVRGVSGRFDALDAVEVADEAGQVVAKGLVQWSAAALDAAAGKRTGELAPGQPTEVIHRDDMVVFTD